MKLAYIAMLPLLLWGALLSAAEKYGDAVIEAGAMTILREGEALSFIAAAEKIPVFEQDLLRLRASSRAVLQTREKSTLTLGSNAVFQVKAWETPRESGFLRALYGRFRAVVADLVGGESFNVQAPTATIGVKGTEYYAAITSHGDSLLQVTENEVEFTGPIGPTQLVGENFFSVVVGNRPATPPIPVPPEVRQSLSDSNLDAPAPNSEAAKSLPAEEAIIREGVIGEDEIEESKSDTIDTEDLGIERQPIQPTELEFDIEEAKDNLFRGNVEIEF